MAPERWAPFREDSASAAAAGAAPPAGHPSAQNGTSRHDCEVRGQAGPSARGGTSSLLGEWGGAEA